MQSFLELGVSPRVAQALAERDIHAPFRIQGLVLPDARAKGYLWEFDSVVDSEEEGQEGAGAAGGDSSL